MYFCKSFLWFTFVNLSSEKDVYVLEVFLWVYVFRLSERLCKYGVIWGKLEYKFLFVLER